MAGDDVSDSREKATASVEIAHVDGQLDTGRPVTPKISRGPGKVTTRRY